MATRTGEFEAWLGPRWPRLVRTAVLLGVSTPTAEAAVEKALAQCWFGWSTITRVADREAWVLGRVVAALSDVPPASLESLGRSDRGDVRDALRVLMPEDRAVVVLQLYTGLDEAQLTEALALDARQIAARGSRAVSTLRGDSRAGALLGRSETASWLSVREAPYAEIEQLARARRRRVWLGALVAVLVVLAVAALLTYGLRHHT